MNLESLERIQFKLTFLSSKINGKLIERRGKIRYII